MSDTTPVHWNIHIQHIRNTFDRLLAITPHITTLTLTPKTYDEYYSAILPEAKAMLTGNPKYRGVEIKKMGEA